MTAMKTFAPLLLLSIGMGAMGAQNPKPTTCYHYSSAFVNSTGPVVEAHTLMKPGLIACSAASSAIQLSGPCIETCNPTDGNTGCESYWSNVQSSGNDGKMRDAYTAGCYKGAYSCSLTTSTDCDVDGDCPAGEKCDFDISMSGQPSDGSGQTCTISSVNFVIQSSQDCCNTDNCNNKRRANFGGAAAVAPTVTAFLAASALALLVEWS